MSFQASAHEEKDGVWIQFRGELDLAASAEAGRLLTQAEQAPHDRLTLDLRGIEFMDSSGLRAIVAADTRAKQAGRRFAVLHGGREAVTRIFSIAGVEGRLEVLPNPD